MDMSWHLGPRLAVAQLLRQPEHHHGGRRGAGGRLRCLVAAPGPARLGAGGAVPRWQELSQDLPAPSLHGAPPLSGGADSGLGKGFERLKGGRSGLRAGLGLMAGWWRAKGETPL